MLNCNGNGSGDDHGGGNGRCRDLELTTTVVADRDGRQPTGATAGTRDDADPDRDGDHDYAARVGIVSRPAASDERSEALVRELIERLGEDPTREGLVRTPHRVAKALGELTAGYDVSPEEAVGEAVFEHEGEEMVLVKDIEFYSLCEHHMLPFFGRAHVAYLPQGKVIGLSKIARLVEVFARRLQVQERLTSQVADALMETLAPHGVAVVMEASHFCMMMRGVQKQSSATVTSAMRGTFKTDGRTREELMQLLRD